MALAKFQTTIQVMISHLERCKHICGGCLFVRRNTCVNTLEDSSSVFVSNIFFLFSLYCSQKLAHVSCRTYTYSIRALDLLIRKASVGLTTGKPLPAFAGASDSNAVVAPRAEKLRRTRLNTLQYHGGGGYESRSCSL